MRRQRALPIIGCGSLGLLALAIGACSSSNKNPVDAATDTTTTTDAPADAPSDVKDAALDKGNDLAVDRVITVDAVDAAQAICTGVAPTQMVIADFENRDNSAFGAFGVDPLIGNTYQNSPTGGLLPADYADQVWHLTGTVHGREDYFGLAWNCTAAPNGGCTMDASQYAGIKFTIKGTAGPSRNINFTLGRKDNDTSKENPPAMCGTCVVPADASSPEAACHGPRIAVALPADPATPTTVMVRWADLVGGSPNVSADPHQITGILWYFDNPPPPSDGGTTADGGTDGGTADGSSASGVYNADLIIDNIEFIPF